MNYIYPKLYVVEDEYTEVAKQYETVLATAQTKITEYCSIMASLKTEEVMKDAAADKIAEFSELASSSFSSYLEDISVAVSDQLQKYIEQIQENDNYSE